MSACVKRSILIPACGDIDSCAHAPPSEQDSHIPLDRRMFLRWLSRWWRGQHESGSPSFSMSRRAARRSQRTDEVIAVLATAQHGGLVGWQASGCRSRRTRNFWALLPSTWPRRKRRWWRRRSHRTLTESFANVIIDGGGSERAVPIVPTLIFGEREEVRERTGTAKHIAIIGLDRAIGIAA